MTGADYIAAFLAHKGIHHVFLVTGGAATFMIDAVGKHPDLDYVCCQHEQAAAMAADAVWRTNRTVGCSMATSGPGATNLLTGIACSFFDSIPSLHITGQVNMKESSSYLGAKPRQSGFQETKIVEMARPITKYAVQIRTGDDLKLELEKAFIEATTGRMGPVLIDVPMDLQQLDVGDFEPLLKPTARSDKPSNFKETIVALDRILAESDRPLVYFGAGVGLAGVEGQVQDWLAATGVPFVSSWNGSTYFDHDLPNFCGTAGVYGNRGANFLIQNCDALIVLGSRLDNRQRSGNTSNFAPKATVFAIDVDGEELAKYKTNGYLTAQLPFSHLPALLESTRKPRSSNAWADHVALMRDRYLGKNFSSYAETHRSQSPYEVIRRINAFVDQDAIVINDTGAAACWFFQTFHRKNQEVFTAGGNSPMGYALPAAIGAKLTRPDRQVISFNGDGGFQMNLQELQTIVHYKLDMVIVILNNFGYGIIKQFQDANMQGRYHASGDGYSQPDLKKVVEAYGIRHVRVENPDQITEDLFRQSGTVVLEVILDPGTQVEPKLEMGRPINDQYPYMSDQEFAEGNAFVAFERRR